MIVAALRRFYRALLPLGLRRLLHVSRYTASRRARAALWTRTGGRVAAGPFRGLLLHGASPDDCEAAVLIGSYECDTHEWLEREIARGWDAVVNVGSNTGLYSTGLALRLPGATVHAFELDPPMQVETRNAADRNGVGGRVIVHGEATPASLAALPLVAALVVSDCEGYEKELLDPVRVPWLRRSAMLVELHDFAAPGATEALAARFGATHEVAVVEQAPRVAAAWASAAGVPVADAELLVREPRTWNGRTLPGRWMLLTPR